MQHPPADTPDQVRSDQSMLPGDVLGALAGAVGKLRFGVVQLTVHDGRVVQLDVTERQRFTR